MDDQKKQLIERINQAQNILVTVSTSPSVDQLSAAIGLTLVLNHLGKHGTAVFSGEVPSTLEFLKPEETLEKNTDSLRDFIIALDKSKADKLRYKVEDEVVRIFITPYKTSISEKDLEFSQGDFNVDVVIALGVREQQDLDNAITSHGRILHDATVASISTDAGNNLGSLNWVDASASSLSELVVGLADSLDKKIIDSQIATALLTGIVATTERFSNDKTSPKTMSVSAELMAAGANQQLIASELETPPEEPESVEIDESAEHQEDQEADDKSSRHKASKKKPEPGTLEIEHESNQENEEPEDSPEDKEPDTPPEPPQPQVQVDEDGKFTTLGADEPLPEISTVHGVSFEDKPEDSEKSEVNHQRLTGPAKQTGNLTANTVPESFDPAAEELTLPPLETPMLSHNESVLPPSPTPPVAPLQPAPQDWQPPHPAPVALPQPPQPPAISVPAPSQSVSASPVITADETLAEIEKSVGSPHTQVQQMAAPETEPTATVDDARSAVEAAYSRPDAPSDPLQPIAALNAQPLGAPLNQPQASTQPITNTGFSEPTPGNSPADQTLDMPLPGSPLGPQQQTPFPQSALSSFPSAPQQGARQVNDPTAPPPVPPPMLPPLQ